MGRELKRVPLDFEWPLKKTWRGYVNPYQDHRPCPDCKNGLAPRAQVFTDQWYGTCESEPFDPAAYGSRPLEREALRPGVSRKVDRDREEFTGGLGHYFKTAARQLPPGVTSGWTHEQRRALAIEVELDRMYAWWRTSWQHQLSQADVDVLWAEGRLSGFPGPVRPSANDVNLAYLEGMGHDSINNWKCVRARCEREGVAYCCETCDGDGRIWAPGEEERSEAWEPEEPPAGDGYQLWETTGDGSPISPVFPTLDALCRHAATHCTTFASFTATAEEWRKMLDDGLVAVEMRNSSGGTILMM